jgi:uncharacterized iron-regulated protein
MMILMKILFKIFIAIVVAHTNTWGSGDFKDTLLFDVARGKKITLIKALTTLKEKRLICVGEQHDQKSHHRAQLLIIRALHESGAPVAIGLEMFRKKDQTALDRWVNNEIGPRAFQNIYRDNWNFPWPLYSMIFDYARDNRIPFVGLNIRRDITQQVAHKGFQSLSPQQRSELPEVACDVDEDYMAFIKRAYGAHPHGNLKFTHFCEAQLIWDTVMALNALGYLEFHPEYTMVLLAGNGHAWKRGIPEQIRRRSHISYAVMLPQIPDKIHPGAVTTEDTDYIILGLSLDACDQNQFNP